jgi:Staphylococcal nuclease homologue
MLRADLAACSRWMLGRLVTSLIAIVTSRRRTDCLTGPAKVIDGDTIVVADELVRLHDIDAPEPDQTFQWRGQQIACGKMSMAALEALIAGVKVRCEVVERDRHGRLVAKVFSPKGVDIGRRLVSAGSGVPAVLDGLCRRRGRGQGGAGCGGAASSSPGSGARRHRAPRHPRPLLWPGRDGRHGSAVFQLIGLGQAETSGLRYQSGTWRGQHPGSVE